MCIRDSYDLYPWDYNIPIGCGGILVIPGDIIVGDDDGVVVIPPKVAEEVLIYCEEREGKEDFGRIKLTETGDVSKYYPMNEEALKNTLAKGQMHYFSRSRQVLWHKGATSGFFQNVKELLIDDDQDALWAKVEVLGGASCHVGYRSCFYRKIEHSDGKAGLLFTDTDKVFDPEAVYGEEPNPTKL